MKYKLEEFESIGTMYGSLLHSKFGIKYVDELRTLTKDQIQKELDVDPLIVEHWIDVLNLFKIPGINSRHAELLYQSDINTIIELSHRQAVRIFYKFRDIDEKTYYIILGYPSFRTIEEWINNAKLMTKRLKNSLSIPMIAVPMMNVDKVTELDPYGIVSIGDFLRKQKMIKGMRKLVKMKRSEYKDLNNFLEIIQIPGVDMYFTKTFWEAGFHDRNAIFSATSESIFNAVKQIQDLEEKPLELLTVTIINEIKKNLEEKIYE